jgi:hypothetical protein
MAYIIAAQRICVISVKCKLEIATPSARNDKRGEAHNDNKSGQARNDAPLLSLRGALPLKGDVAIYLKGYGVEIAAVLHVSRHSASDPSHCDTQQFASLVGYTVGQPFPPSFVIHNILSLFGKISEPV